MIEAAEVGELYRVPLGDFTRARDDLSARLSRDGDADGAKIVKALRKPTVAAWAVNQLAHEQAAVLRELLDLRERLKTTADAAELRSASQERRKLISRLSEGASEILQRAGHAPTAATLEKITQTLQAGESPEERELLARGRLTKELRPSGLEGFPIAALAAVDSGEQDTRGRAKAKQLAAEADAAERRAEALEWEAEVARQAARKAERAAAAARRKAVTVRERAEKAGRDV